MCVIQTQLKSTLTKFRLKICRVESATTAQFSERQSVAETRLFLYGSRMLISELSAATGLHHVRWTPWSFYAYS